MARRVDAVRKAMAGQTFTALFGLLQSAR